MSTSPGAIAENAVVAFNYKLTGSDGNLLDTSEGGEPLSYLHGAGNLIHGLESAMLGHAVGDNFDVEVSPEDGYGVREGPGPQTVPRNVFPDDTPLEPGTPFFTENEDGEQIPLWIVGIDGDNVLIDQQHPLAGQTLHFHVEIVEIREATQEELDHGHPHGPGGHHH
jgi:FKBP-type peptidyl-prolyl cis-trans isomerase SlyD